MVQPEILFYCSNAARVVLKTPDSTQVLLKTYPSVHRLDRFFSHFLSCFIDPSMLIGKGFVARQCHMNVQCAIHPLAPTFNLTGRKTSKCIRMVGMRESQLETEVPVSQD